MNRDEEDRIRREVCAVLKSVSDSKSRECAELLVKCKTQAERETVLADFVFEIMYGAANADVADPHVKYVLKKILTG